jgi:methyl-accepting chemotaxis protein
MDSNHILQLNYAPILLLVSLIMTSPVASALGSRPQHSDERKSSTQMTQEELQAAVISYANRFIATIGQAAFDLEAKIPTKEGRLIASARKVYSLSAAAEIAAGPNPGPALLDLVVMVTLNRMVWDSYWRPQVFGTPATIMVGAFEKMEADAWNLVAKVMTPEQMDELYDLIVAWNTDHPNQKAVDYIRFSDFGEIGTKPNLKEIQKPGGLLAPVQKATEAVDEVRMTSERAMFLLTKMQLIMGFQAEMVYKQLVMQPEMDTLLKDISGFRVTADRFTDLAEKLPAQVADERTAAFSDARRLLARERTAVLSAIDDKATLIHQINKDVQGTLDRIDAAFSQLRQITADSERLIQGLQQAVSASQQLVAAVDGIAARFESTAPSSLSRPFDINEYTAALEKIQTTVDSLNQLTNNVSETSTPMVAHLLDRFNKAADDRVDHFFKRCVQLLVTAGFLFLVLFFIVRMVRQTQKRSGYPDG